MPPPVFQEGLLPSILDRLIDPESAGTAIMTGYNPDKMYRAVLRDLEDLLNTRRSVGTLSEKYDEVLTSIFCYGLPDIGSLELTSYSSRKDVAGAIREVINVFEPRLKDVVVTFLDPEEDLTKQSLRFRVDARMNVDPSPDITFDTVLEMASGHYVVTPGANE